MPLCIDGVIPWINWLVNRHFQTVIELTNVIELLIHACVLCVPFSSRITHRCLLQVMVIKLIRMVLHPSRGFRISLFIESLNVTLSFFDLKSLVIRTSLIFIWFINWILSLSEERRIRAGDRNLLVNDFWRTVLRGAFWVKLLTGLLLIVVNRWWFLFMVKLQLLNSDQIEKILFIRTQVLSINEAWIVLCIIIRRRAYNMRGLFWNDLPLI